MPNVHNQKINRHNHKQYLAQCLNTTIGCLVNSRTMPLLHVQTYCAPAL